MDSENGNTIEKYGITQFNGKDYDHWRFRMENILYQNQVQQCIEKECENPDAEFLILNTKCKSSLI